MCGLSVKIAVAGMIVVSMIPTVRAGNFDMPSLVAAPRMVAAKPGQLAVSPSGDRVAVTDRFNNVIHIVNTSGDPLWSVGEGMSLAQPTAVVFVSDRELVFSEWDSRVLFRVTEDNPKTVDTVVDLSEALSRKAHIVRLCRLRDRKFLVLTENPDKLMRFDSEWKQPRVLIEGGSRKGKLGHATSCVEMVSGRLVVTGNSLYPVQFFDSEGAPLITADWNSPAPAGGWLASAVAVDAREIIWVADATNSQFRRYDQTGTMWDTRPFTSPAFQPTDMAVTSDNRLFVVSSNGRLEIYDLTQER